MNAKFDAPSTKALVLFEQTFYELARLPQICNMCCLKSCDPRVLAFLGARTTIVCLYVGLGIAFRQQRDLTLDVKLFQVWHDLCLCSSQRNSICVVNIVWVSPRVSQKENCSRPFPGTFQV